MSDIQVLIEVIGEKDMVKATRTATRMRNEYSQLDKAFNRGEVSAQKYAQGIQQVDSKYDALIAAQKQATTGAQQHTAAVKGNTGAMATQAMAAQRSSKGLKHFASIGLQQVGYQVSDFTVQVQGGTSALVAFGQQGSQLAGLLFLIPGMFGAIAGAVTSIAIPAFTALGNVMFNLGNGTKDVEKAMEALSETVSRVDKAVSLQKMSIVELVDEYGTLAVNIREAQVAAAEYAAQEAFIKLDKSEALATDFFAKIRSGFKGLRDAQDGIFEPLIEQTENPLQVVQDNFSRMAESIDLSTQEALRLGTAIDDFDKADNLREKGRAAADLAAAFGTIPEPVREANKELFGAVEKLAEMSEMAARATRGQELLNDSAPGANWMDNAITGVNSLIQRIFVAVAGVEKLNTDLEGPSYSFDPVSGKYKESGDSSTFEERLAERMGLDLGTGTLGSPGSKRKGSGGGAGGSAIDERQKMLDSVNQLIAGYDEEYAKALKVKEATKLIADAQRLGAIPANMEANEVLRDYIASLEDTKNPMADFVNNSANQMANAFTSLVEGSKSASDAFRDMARSIIKQAFEMAVVNPIINGIFGGSSSFIKLPTFANGAAFSGGRVTAFADGGVVSKPTMFPMANGAGLMGEAGPEAIMPLKRGKGGKLGVAAEGGSSGPVTVNNHFHIAANGDDSVRRIIQSEAPKISAMTEKQIINSRRRGGSLKQAFG